MNQKSLVRIALRFVLVIGAVNLLADFTYEGARSVNGAFLASLGASAVTVGFVAGFGELIGYGLRSVTGFFAGRTHRYWAFAFVGYAVNMLAVPALALAGNWPVAAGLMIAERTGRAIRKPAMETMLSFAGREMGQGWAFGLNEFLDQLGATMGPLVVAYALFLKGSYRGGYAMLLISALLCLGGVAVARMLFPQPQALSREAPVALATKGFSRAYWLYVAAGGLLAAGFADFSLIAFHFQKTGAVAMQWIPILYAVAMATAAVSALGFGWALDKIGTRSVPVALALGALAAPFVFLGGFAAAFAGMMLWGIGMGAQDAMLKAVLSRLVPSEKRSTAFGVFDTGFGVAWFAGSAAMGIIYTWSVPGVVVFSMVLQFAAVPVFASFSWRPKGA